MEIWDTELPESGTGETCVYIANVLVKINDREIKTGYGANIDGKHHTLESICSFAEKSGITVTESIMDKGAFHIIGVK